MGRGDRSRLGACRGHLRDDTGQGLGVTWGSVATLPDFNLPFHLLLWDPGLIPEHHWAPVSSSLNGRA